MKLYFKRAELLLDQSPEGDYILQMGKEILGRFRREKKAITEYNRIRRELEAKLPPTEISPKEKQATLDRYLADNLVGHNSLRGGPPKKPAKSRTFG